MLKNKLKQISLLQQWSPTLLAPETSFVEDNFSTDGGGRPRGGTVQAVMRAMESGR